MEEQRDGGKDAGMESSSGHPHFLHGLTKGLPTKLWEFSFP